MKKVLLVEDYEATRQATADLLRQAGYVVSETSSGFEALRCVQEERPQLVLLDINLPDLSGLEVCRRIKSDPTTAHTLVLEISGLYTGTNDKAQGLNSGADGYLIKPVEPVELLATIRSLFRLHEAEEEARQERLRAEAAATRFRGLIDGLKAIVWEADAASLRFTFVSRRAEELLGFPISRWLEEEDFWTNLIHPAEREAVVSACQEATRAGRDHDLEYRVITADKREVWLHDLVFVEPREAGRVTKLSGVMLDVTARKQDALALQQASLEREAMLRREQLLRLEAEEASRLKDEFLTTLSHELRTPLHLILGNLRLLQDGYQEPKAAHLSLQTAYHQTEKLWQLVSDLLDAAELITGRLQLKPEPLDFLPLITAVLDTLQPTAQAKSINMSLHSAQSVYVLVGDPLRLRQIVWNLLTNAIRFTPPEGRVELRLRTQNSEVELAVRDTGVGISPAFLPFVFDRFRQADGSTKRPFSGLGLGLAVVRHLVELHGGSITAQSDGEGQGATFTVRLPIRVPHQERPAQPTTEAVPQSPLTAASYFDPNLFSGLNILIVEPDVFTREFCAYTLGNCGATLRTITAPEDALRLLDTWSPDVLLLDAALPEAPALLQHAQSQRDNRAVPAVGLLAHNTSNERVRALSLGFRLYLVRPILPDELLMVVASLTGRAKRSAQADSSVAQRTSLK